MLAAALPAFRRAPDWQHAVHDTIEAMFAFGAEEPEYARLDKKGPETLPDLVPTLVYVTLAPFLSGQEAYEVSIG
jgi:hypothetical protein